MGSAEFSNNSVAIKYINTLSQRGTRYVVKKGGAIHNKV